ncbi:putative ribonuclease III [Medicago truncatula]|uniref:Putative ribonuclease III n=1 Tax=Medicago truncatula TaxID=3880 RepID=G7J6P0_MEDTR|nr:ribonuclease 3-like protein 3 [Medicago truncatula]AES71622.2 ribonuclease 3-like protein [Medicago truncatula]RHN68919.1 putative ribonuclease III [Medicago truncatula]
MEAQAYKEQEEALLIQTLALQIDNKEELSHKQEKEDTNNNDHKEKLSPKQEKEDTTTINNNISPPPPPLYEVEEILGYEFKNKQLLEEALTHTTYGAENDYERLEYVGDAVLNLLMAREQFVSYPNLKPGILTQLRSKNVDSEKLARVAINHGLDRYLRHKKPQLGEQIEAFTKAIEDYPIHSNGHIHVPKDLADMVESTIGALFIDCDSSLEIVWKVFRKLLEPIIEPNTVEKHPVSELQEVCQKKKLNLQFVDLWEKSMNIDVFINEKFVGRGTYGSKKDIAHYRAAKNALDNIERVLSGSTSIVEDALVD